MIVALLEMAFAGNCGLHVAMTGTDMLSVMFAEEVGWLLQVEKQQVEAITQQFAAIDVPFPRGHLSLGPKHHGGIQQ